MGIPDAPLDGLRKHKHRITFWLVVLLLLTLGFFGGLFLYFFLGDDLVLDLYANQTSFRITNSQDAHVSVTMSTTGQLFCRTDCRLALLDASSRSISVEDIEMRRGMGVTRDFTLSPGRVGQGQSLYSVTATCRNVESALCPTLAPEWRKTVLLTVNYGLDTDEEAIKPALKENLETMLAQLRDIDITLQQVALGIAENPHLRAGELTADMTLAQERFAQHNLFLENAKLLWAQQSYVPLADMVERSNTTSAELGSLQDDAAAIAAAFLDLPRQHNGLALRIDEDRRIAQALLESYAPLEDDAASRAAMARVVAETDALIATYMQDLFTSYAGLADLAYAVERNISLSNLTLADRQMEIVRIGNAIIVDEARMSCENCSNETLANITSDRTTLAGVCEGLANSTNMTYRQLHCVERNSTFRINPATLAQATITLPEATSAINTTLPEHVPLCCVFGECKPCCSACADDPATYPVLFVHGHSFNSFNSPEYSLGGYFTKIQQRLQEEGYVDAGILTPSSTLSEVEPGEWGLSGRPVTIRATYYYNFYRDEDGAVTVAQKSENIETYAIRLNEIIKATQHHTGKQKVTIVAHSMGGLVVRRYMQLFGEDAIDKVIFIATPNNGVEARTRTLCPIFGESKECDDMSQGSVFMRKLNDPENQPDVEFVTITAHGCPVGGKDADGVVTAESVAIAGARNYDINGTCADFFNSELHTEILNIDKYPEVYDIIREEIKAER